MKDDYLRVPLLIWVDDNYKSGDAADLIKHAKEQGVYVKAFDSTLDAERYIHDNIDFLSKHNTGAPKNVRVVTDMVRKEDMNDGKGKVTHAHAGWTITKYIRDRLGNVPVLVRTRPNFIENTRWVSEFWLVGSTTKKHVSKEYIDQLADKAEHKNGVHWLRYDAS